MLSLYGGLDKMILGEGISGRGPPPSLGTDIEGVAVPVAGLVRSTLSMGPYSLKRDEGLDHITGIVENGGIVEIPRSHRLFDRFHELPEKEEWTYTYSEGVGGDKWQIQKKR